MVLALVLSGLALRAAYPARMAVEHFDEGVYASNLWFKADQRFRYPARHLYAPPLVPWLLEWSQIFFGPTRFGTMLVGMASGTLTIGLIWWAVRGWFGIPAGIAASALAAFSDYHGLFSRTALTEPVLGLLLLSSVFFLWAALAKVDFRLALMAGLGTGLAWCAKYNGWLPMAIGAAGLSAWAIRPQEVLPLRARRFVLLGLIAAIAMLLFSPVWWGLAEDGGYRAVQENHARYLVGVSGWWEAFTRQVANHRHLDGPVSWVGLLLAVLGSCLFSRQQLQTMEPKRIRRWLWAISWSAFVAVLAMWMGTSVVLGLTGLVWLVAACPWWGRRGEESGTANDLTYWLIAAWFLGLLLSTPLYTPYARLSLPWLLAAWIAFAAMMSSTCVRRLALGQATWQSSQRGTVCLVVLGSVSIVGCVGKMILAPPTPPAMWEDRTGLETIAGEIHQHIITRHDGTAMVAIYAEPALFYHLKAQGLELVAPVADLGFAKQSLSVPVLLVVGPHAQRSAAFQTEFQNARGRWELVAEYPYRPSPLVLLDQFSPEEIREPGFPSAQSIEVYLQKPF